MQINGNLKFQVLGSGELQNAIIERLASAPTGAAGRLYYDTVVNAYFYYDGTSWQQLAAGTTSVSSFSAGTTGLTPSTATTGAITLAGTLNATHGGTGFASYAVGDFLYADTTTSLAKLTASDGLLHMSSGAPSWGSVDLTADVSGILPVPNGGTGLASLTSKGVLVGNGAGNVTVTAAGSQFNVFVAGAGGTPGFGTVDLSQAAAVGSSVLNGANGGTGVANTGKSITLGGNLTTSGAFSTTLTVTGNTNVTLPTSGTLVTTTTAVTSVTGTANQITSTGANAVVLSIPNTFIAPGTVEVTDTLTIDTNTAGAFLYSDATSNVVSTGAATNGQLLIGSTGADPVAATLTASTGISITNGAGSITIANTGVTSVAVASDSSPALTVVSGSPVTTTGTIHLALGAELTGLQAITGTGIVVRDGTGTYATSAITGTAGNITVANGDAVAANPTINLATVTQGATGSFLKFSLDGFGRVVSNTPVVTGDITALADSQYLRLDGTTTPSANIPFGGFKITNLGTPTTGTDATNKNYVDALVSGLEWKAAAQAATTANGTLATAFVAGTVIDGYTLVLGDRLLIKDQTVPTQNGIYIVTAGTPTRSTDAATTAELNNATLFIINGTVNGDTGWTQTTPNPVVGTDPIVFQQFTGAGTYVAGTGLSLTGNTFSVNLGAGIVSLPSNEVGIDLFDASTGALILTDNGTSRATDSASQLYLLLKAAGGLVQDVNGLYIPTAGVTNAMLVNSTIPVDVDGVGTTTMTLGTTFNYFGTANRITTTAAANTVTFDIDSGYVGQSSITTLGTVTTGTWNATTVAANHGGTGFSSYTVGDLLYADSTSTLAALADVAVGNVLLSGGVATAPSWGKVSLTAAVSGILPAANGGTGVANSNTITLGGNINTAGALTTTGANALTIATTGTTSVTMPTSGTLISTATIASNAVTTFQTSLSGLTPSTATNGAVTLAGTLGVPSGGTGATTLTQHGVLLGQGTGAVTATAVGATNTVLHGNTGGDPTFSAVDLTADVSGVLPVANGGTSLSAVGVAGTVLSTTDGTTASFNPIQYVHTFASGTSFTVTHNLGQKYVLVQVYDNTDNQIIPQSIVLTSTTQCTVTVNSAIAVTIVVMGIAGV